MSASTLRLFVAIPLPEPIKQSIADWCAGLQKELPFRKWVHREDLHITLQFLGRTPTGKLEEIKQALQSAAYSAEPFELSVEPLGTFGRPSCPSILWAGIGGDTGKLGSLHKRVAGALSPLGFEPDKRPFRPHLTLARDYTGQEFIAGAKLAEYTAPLSQVGEALQWRASEVVLYVSHLNRGPAQPMYEASFIAGFGLPPGRSVLSDEKKPADASSSGLRT